MTGNRHDYRVTENGIVWLDEEYSIWNRCRKRCRSIASALKSMFARGDKGTKASRP